jgi:hypothetical protein
VAQRELFSVGEARASVANVCLLKVRDVLDGSVRIKLKSCWRSLCLPSKTWQDEIGVRGPACFLLIETGKVTYVDQWSVAPMSAVTAGVSRQFKRWCLWTRNSPSTRNGESNE